MRKFLLNVAIVVTVLIAAERAVAVPPAFLWEARADREMCAVYRSFYRDVSKAERSVLHAGTARWRPMISLDRERDAREGWKAIRFNPGGLHAPEAPAVEVNVSTYFAPLMREQSLFIRHCFEETGVAPFHDGLPLALTLGDLVQGRGDRTLWWELSPVGISPDGQSALIYATNTLGMDAFGMFFLFERRGQDWVLAGTSLSWIT